MVMMDHSQNRSFLSRQHWSSREPTVRREPRPDADPSADTSDRGQLTRIETLTHSWRQYRARQRTT